MFRPVPLDFKRGTSPFLSSSFIAKSMVVEYWPDLYARLSGYTSRALRRSAQAGASGLTDLLATDGEQGDYIPRQ